MELIIENIQDKIRFDENFTDLLNKAVEISLKSEGFVVPAEISILLVNDEQIREMNKEHRKIDKATDVLSFPMVDMFEGKIQSDRGDYDLDEELILLGDIVISLETAKRQADEYGHSFERELAFLVTHGVFHLLGYDHEEESQEKTMMEKQENVLGSMQLGR